MHHNRITHRDLKPANILLERIGEIDLHVKIADFGFSCIYDPKDGLDSKLGSPLYMAPEIIKREVYDSKVDIWAFGCIAYQMLCGIHPFQGKD
jgi:serine/threonine protein kinase